MCMYSYIVYMCIYTKYSICVYILYMVYYIIYAYYKYYVCMCVYGGNVEGF